MDWLKANKKKVLAAVALGVATALDYLFGWGLTQHVLQLIGG